MKAFGWILSLFLLVGLVGCVRTESEVEIPNPTSVDVEKGEAIDPSTIGTDVESDKSSTDSDKSTEETGDGSTSDDTSTEDKGN